MAFDKNVSHFLFFLLLFCSFRLRVWGISMKSIREKSFIINKCQRNERKKKTRKISNKFFNIRFNSVQTKWKQCEKSRTKKNFYSFIVSPPCRWSHSQTIRVCSDKKIVGNFKRMIFLFLFISNAKKMMEFFFQLSLCSFWY